MVQAGPAKKRRITTRHISEMSAPTTMRDSQPLVALAPLFDRITGELGVGFSIREEDRDIYVSERYSRLMTQGQEPLLENTIDLKFDDCNVQLRLLSLDEQDEKLTTLMKMAMLGEIAAGLAHDFRNALMVIRANLPSLCEAAAEGFDCHGRSFEEIIYETNASVDLAAGMCGRVLSIGVKSRERMLVTDNLKTIVDSAVGMANIKIKEAAADGRYIIVDTFVADPLYARMVSSEVQMAVMNILFNAVRYCGLDGKEGIISIHGFRNQDKVILAIGNNGPEIAEEVQEILLKKPLTTACVHGYGLCTAAKSLKSFGGDLTFLSNPMRTVFRITLEAAEDENSINGGIVNWLPRY